jgi:primosomal protein N' (replication factor Y)
MSSPPVYHIAIASPLRRLFDYLAPRHEREPLSPGCRVLVSFGRRKDVGIVVGSADQSELEFSKLKPIEKVLDDAPAIPPDIIDLCRWASEYYHHSLGEVFHQALPTLLRSAEHQAEEVETFWQATEKGLLIGPDTLKRSQKQWETLLLLRDHPQGLSTGMLKHLGILPANLKALAAKHLAELHTRNALLEPFTTDAVLAETPLTPNVDQQAALNAIVAHQGFQAFLLEGVTGSGKTEVYLQAIEACLRRGEQALVLIPEIGLTPQTLGRFRQRFNVPVLALHSGLSDRERLLGWRQARAGAVAVIIGTRSAVFTPLHKPGLIIVDEEHDSSFKQQDGFRYSARDLALVRAKQLNVPVILGSATPSLESLHNADQGRYRLLALPNRAGDAAKAPYQILDIKGQTLKAGVSEHALKLGTQCLKRGEQVLFFMNRRGYAPVLLCHDCGWHAKCRHCDAHMTLHRDPVHLHCHHCDTHIPVPTHCPTCGSSDMRPVGQGTERIEDTLTELFPKFPVVRIDRDSTRSAERLQKQLRVIHEGKPCLLVGTQMLAKGHHFPHVTLVVIMDVDGGLFSGDFRGLEHTGQLIDQVAGRAGRSEKRGQVLLQTHHPEHPALRLLVEQGYRALANSILFERRLVELPPYGHIAVLRAEAQHAIAARMFLLDAKNAGESFARDIDMLGPIPAAMGRKSGRYRFQLVLKSTQRPALHRFLHAWLALVEALPSGKKARWHLDVDPVQLDD